MHIEAPCILVHHGTNFFFFSHRFSPYLKSGAEHVPQYHRLLERGSWHYRNFFFFSQIFPFFSHRFSPYLKSGAEHVPQYHRLLECGSWHYPRCTSASVEKKKHSLNVVFVAFTPHLCACKKKDSVNAVRGLVPWLCMCMCMRMCKWMCKWMCTCMRIRMRIERERERERETWGAPQRHQSDQSRHIQRKFPSQTPGCLSISRQRSIECVLLL